MKKWEHMMRVDPSMFQSLGYLPLVTMFQWYKLRMSTNVMLLKLYKRSIFVAYSPGGFNVFHYCRNCSGLMSVVGSGKEKAGSSTD
ncbi:hypothetical protein RchiOBHm_Chr1g0376311 [Rosa chinensis]|uniref:Uncharacterized protein n=1 Tax=Rosa chinensis TaxID=74649 RepID=A0A2P6SMT6_ROSCH|nr:hypothetical protein RchiOBHm_Chr1g0376311 [Rosa chinensis]